MKAVSLVKLVLLISIIAAFFATDSLARFLIDDVQDDAKQDLPKPKDDKGQSPIQVPQSNAGSSYLPADYPRNLSVVLIPGEKNGVQITWDAAADAKDSFVILRSNQLQNTPEIALGALPVKVIPADRLRVVLDRNLPPGRYFYSVVPKSKFDDRNVRLYPGENYNTNPIIIFGETELSDSRTVSHFKAVTIEDRNVLLTWEPINNFNGEYVIFRSKSPIDSPEKLNNADPIGRISAVKTRFLDTEATPGRHYYAIACKTLDGILYSDMRKTFNYTEDAIFIGGTIGVRSIRAKYENGNVLITWKMTADSFNKMFYLLRTEVRPSARESIAGAYIVDTIPSASEKYIDKNVSAGKFYYVLAPMNYRDNDDFVLIGGVNVTDPPLTIVSEEQGKPQKKEADPASHENNSAAKKEQSPPSKTDTRTQKNDSKKAEKGPSEEEILAYLEELKDLSADKPVIPKNDKPIVPQKTRSNVDPRFPWENETETFEDTTEDKTKSDNKKAAPTQEPKKVEPKKTAAPQQGTQAKKIEPERTAAPTPKKVEPKKSETPTQARKKTPQKTTPRKITSIDAVIAGPFADGDYNSSITLLKTALKYAANQEESAKAKLFIARSYIELGNYRDALGYLSGADVKKYYPRESGFWKDYSIDRLK